jgi:hypothetical protein
MDGCIGSDGIWVRDGLEKAGVDVGRVKVVDDEVSSCVVSSPQERSIDEIGNGKSDYPNCSRWREQYR